MKVQELLPGSKPSPSPRTGKGARAEGGPSDFADALTDARKKPEPKPAQSDAPVARKPAARKEKTPQKDAPPADQPPVAPEEDAPPAPVAQGEEAVVEEDAPVMEGEAQAPPEPDAQVPADATLIAVSQVPLQEPPVVVADDGTPDPEPTETAAPVAAPTARRPAELPPNPSTATGARDVVGLAARATEEGSDEQGDGETGFSVEDLLVDAKRPQWVEQSPVKRGAAGPVGDADAPEAETANDAATAAPVASAEFASGPEVSAGAVPAQSASAIPDGGSAPSATSIAPVPPDAAKPQAAHPAPPAPASAPPPAPQEHFIEANHPRIVTAVRGELLPHGGTMQIRLDPPELGALQVMVHMTDGVMTASFQTSNDDATKLLSHSLSQLKQVLESQGVSVEKLQVQQARKDQQAGNQNDDRQQQRDSQDDAHRQEQQRKEMLRRMWRRLANGSDPLDLVA